MVSILELNFSHRFDGVIWNMVAGGKSDPFLIEVRDVAAKRVSFSALDADTGEFLWRDKMLEEPWWLNLTLVNDGVVLFTVYLDTNNPDKKGVLAYGAANLDLIWWNNDFSVSSLSTSALCGYSHKYGMKEVTVEMRTGKEITVIDDGTVIEPYQLQKPLQYVEGTEYFGTVKTFLSKQLNLDVVSALEYLETEKCMVISCYLANARSHDLANFLIVFSKAGECLLKEEISSRIKGIGFDTFFVLRNNLIFTKNKNELVSYRIL